MDGRVFWSDKVCAAVISASGGGIGWLSLLVLVVLLLLMFLLLVLLPVLGLRRHSVRRRRVILVDLPMLRLVGVLLSLVAHLLMVARCSGVSAHIVLLIAVLIVAILV